MELNWKYVNTIAGLIFILILLYFFLAPNPTIAYKRLPIGSSYSELISLAGSPTYETDGTLWVEPEYKRSKEEITEGCVKELWYEYWIKFVPSKYSFCFDTENILLGKYYWSSW